MQKKNFSHCSWRSYSLQVCNRVNTVSPWFLLILWKWKKNLPYILRESILGLWGFAFFFSNLFLCYSKFWVLQYSTNGNTRLLFENAEGKKAILLPDATLKFITFRLVEKPTKLQWSKYKQSFQYSFGHDFTKHQIEFWKLVKYDREKPRPSKNV